jgi:Domain of unknown function (DUF4282)
MSYDPGAPGDRPQQPVGQGWSGGQQYAGGYGQQQPPPGPGWGQQPPAGMPSPMAPGERKGFAALFDFSFTSFATPSLIRLLYIVGTVLIGLYYVGMVIFTFSTSAVAGLLALVFGAVVALFMMALLRVSLEFYFAVVRMSEDIHNRR